MSLPAQIGTGVISHVELCIKRHGETCSEVEARLIMDVHVDFIDGWVSEVARDVGAIVVVIGRIADCGGGTVGEIASVFNVDGSAA